MIQLFPDSSRHSVKGEWLESHFSFSFGNYYDESNVSFGPFRVFNEDIIQPGEGFGLHPHREMEIVSIVLKGEIKHEDSMGNKGILSFGSVQRMSAGTGVLHSEVNPSQDEETHLLQLWFLPETSQLQPSYEDTVYDTNQLKNQLLPIVSHTPSDKVAKIHQNMTIYLSKMDKGEKINFRQEKGRKIYLFAIEGKLLLNSINLLNTGDAARISDTEEIALQATEETFLMLIDLPGGY
jgi:redox-sensitive bicupin YhaK (pirin superfamily)